eukprot:316581_1
MKNQSSPSMNDMHLVLSDDVSDDLTIYKSMSMVQIQQDNFVHVRYITWCLFKYAIFIIATAVLIFTMPQNTCERRFIPLHVSAIQFFVIVFLMISLEFYCAHLSKNRKINVLTLWICNMFITYQFLDTAFKIVQCEDKDNNVCELFPNSKQLEMSFLDIILWIMFLLWLCRICVNCCCGDNRHQCEYVLNTLVFIVWFILSASMIPCLFVQAIQAEYIVWRLILRTMIFLSAMDTFVFIKEARDAFLVCICGCIKRKMSYQLWTDRFKDSCSADMK